MPHGRGGGATAPGIRIRRVDGAVRSRRDV